MPGDGQFDHVTSLLEAGESWTTLVRWMGSGHEPDLLEGGLVAALLRENQVPNVDRVKRATKNADSHETAHKIRRR
jgi:hypothetical protein